MCVPYYTENSISILAGKFYYSSQHSYKWFTVTLEKICPVQTSALDFDAFSFFWKKQLTPHRISRRQLFSSRLGEGPFIDWTVCIFPSLSSVNEHLGWASCTTHFYMRQRFLLKDQIGFLCKKTWKPKERSLEKHHKQNYMRIIHSSCSHADKWMTPNTWIFSDINNVP